MAQGRHIVLAGATGLIGPKLARELVRRGYRVTILARDPESARRKLPGMTNYLPWSSSMKDGEWRTAVADSDVVINLAGATVATRWTEKQKQSIRESRIQSTRNIVDAIAAAERKPAVLINASAVGYYGTSETATFPEDAPAGNDFLAIICRDWEKEAERARELGVRVVLLRTGIVLDPDGGALAKLLPTFKLGLGGPLGSGRQWFPWIHRDDELDIILWALENEQVEGPLNAAAPGITTNKQFSNILGDVLHRPAIFPVPAFVLKLVFGGGAAALTEGQRAVPERTTKLGYTFRFPDLEPALRDLLKS